MTEYLRGSEWRRWDLHLHTPGTKKNDNFTGTTLDEKWEHFYSAIDSYIEDEADPAKSIAVIGITDYLSVENYQKVVADNRLPDSVSLVLPNVEMRIQPIANDSPINIHFLFDPALVGSIDDRFFGKLKFRRGTTDFSAARSELVRLGKAIDSTLDDEKAYRKGIEQYVPSFDIIQEVFANDSDLRGHTIILVSNSSNDGVSGAANHSDYFDTDGQDSQLKAFRQSIYKFVDGIFSATPSDIAYFSGTKPTCPPELVIEQCGSLKPCVHGCDAHDNENLFEPSDQKYCWIKADPTFNGLKQIIYEPDERVKISATMPDYKPPYYVIDCVEFNDDEFQTQPVFFSDKLTCIIGGKSTGKSILLHNLALSIDKQQVKDNEEVSTTTTKDVVNLTTVWADGASGDQRKIVYIPQTYLNRLSDEKESTTKIDSIIKEIVLLNPEARTSHSTMLASIKSYKAELNKSFLDLIETHNELIALNEQKKELGNRTSIETEIANLNKQKETLSKDLSLSEYEIHTYEQATKRIGELTKQIASINSEADIINGYQSVVERIALDYSLSDETRAMLDTVIVTLVEAADKAWATAKMEIVKKLSEPLSPLGQELKTFKETEATLKPKVQGNKAIAELADKIKAENDKLQQYIDLDGKCSITLKKENEIIEAIVASAEYFRCHHQEFADVVNNNADLSSQELNFSVIVPFRRDDFIEKLSAIFSIGSRVFKQVINPDEFKPEHYTKDKLLEITKKLLSGELARKGGTSIERALQDIFDDWYNTKYNVKMDNDDIDVMSPGKKALVLLKLLIDLAESNCPILIDQPEDDLDNRSIFDDLIPFVRKKKRQRQIIVVTHNANVVLGADAEEIIVANQRGNNAPNKEHRFEYRSGSIENDMPVYKADGAVDDGILNSQGIQQHICDILEGGVRAFELRKHKYHI
jgi:ABC-type cobalamin/Fe3+-siderophores transport system ATPase subunit